MSKNVIMNYLFASIILFSACLIISNSTAIKSKSFLQKDTQFVKVPKGWFNIISKNGLCVEANEIDGQLTQEQCNTSDDQLWKQEKTATGYLYITRSGKVMANQDNLKKNGNPVNGSEIFDDESQIWDYQTIKNTNAVYLRFLNKKANMCFESTDEPEEGKGLITWDCNWETGRQHFRLEEQKPEEKLIIPKGYFNIVGSNGNCMAGRGKLLFKNLTQEPCSEADHFLWKVLESKTKKGGLLIANKEHPIIDAYAFGSHNGARIVGWGFTDNGAQIWGIELVGNGQNVQFVNLQSKKCIENVDNKETPYVMWDCDKTKNQQWFTLQ